jgi:hypothetical protein
MLRFGCAEVQRGQEATNMERLAMEVGDLLVMIEETELVGLIRRATIEKGRRRKRQRLAQYMQTTLERIVNG